MEINSLNQSNGGDITNIETNVEQNTTNIANHEKTINSLITRVKGLEETCSSYSLTLSNLRGSIATLSEMPFIDIYKETGDMTLSKDTLSKVEMTTIAHQSHGYGSYLSLYNGGVKCSKDGCVICHYSAMFSPRKGYCGIHIYRSNTWINDTFAPAGVTGYGTVVGTSIAFNVSAGDVIYMKAQSNVAGDALVKSPRTHLLVQYINIPELAV